MTTWRRTLLLAWAGSAALAAAGQEPPFGGEERVTAVDLLVRIAADAARQALVYFADDPRTAERQARTLILLGEVYREGGEEQKARAALRRAARRDPRALAGHPVLAALPAAPEAALGALAETTGNSLVRADLDLEGALDALDRWGTVTVQLSGPPDRGLHEVEIRRAPGGVRLAGPGWLRFGTPGSVAEARKRRSRSSPRNSFPES